MPFITWSEDLNIDVAIIDEQHKRIVHLINGLYDARQTNDTAKVGEVIDELLDYTISHFAFEESLLEKANYPFLEPHKRVHELFVARVNGFVKRFNDGEDITGELLRLLQRWLINHIKSEDADYSDVVRQHMQKNNEDMESGWLKLSLKKFFG